MSHPLDLQAVEALFTGPQGYAFARWGRPLVPVVFGLEERVLGTIKGAFEAVAALAGRGLADHDPEQGANLMLFFCRDWAELGAVPRLDGLVEGLPALILRLEAAQARQYRLFRFDPDGAIRAVIVFLRLDPEAEVSAELLALDQAVRCICTWSEQAFPQGTLTESPEGVVLRPWIAGVIRAAYDPVLPAATRDATHALRLAARLGRGA